MIWLAPIDQQEAKECKEKEEKEDKQGHHKEWNMFAADIVNICIIQPHPSIICWIFKVGDINCSYHVMCGVSLYMREVLVLPI